MSTFIHLRSHSAYSLSEGAISVDDLPILAREWNMPAVAITDTNNLFGALEFSLACAKKGIQPIIGATISLLVPELSRIVLLAKDEVGYGNLMRIVSNIHLEKKYPSIHEICALHQGLILLTGGARGPISHALRHHNKDYGVQILNEFHEAFKDRLYIEIERHGTVDEDVVEEPLINLAFDHHIPLVATNCCYFKDPSYHQAHDALLCIASGTYISQEDRPRVTPHHYFKSQEEMVALFSDLPEAIEQTVIIAKRCHYMPPVRSPLLPKFPTTRTEKEELQAQAWEGLAKRLKVIKPGDPELYEKRLTYELDVIDQMGFNGYFLIVSDFIKYAKSQNIPVGPGRGSGAGSLVAYSLTITDLDPIYFGLIFERFLNPERVSMPDFDVDFCQDRRDEVIAYVQKRYGADHVAHIITFGKLQARAVVRDVGRVLQIPYNRVDGFAKMIPSNPASPVTLSKALEISEQMAALYAEDEVFQTLIDLGLKLEGLYRHASTHAAGVVIADRPLIELVPLYLDDKSSIPATQFSMKYAELAGLVKFDFLGLKTLSIIQKISDEIQKESIVDFHILNIPLDDAKTFELLTNVKTFGVFQLESPGMRDVLRKMRPDRFEDLIALVALYRPGPMDDIPKYLARKHGEEEIAYLHPMMESILKSTYGVMVYQEQVMKIAQVLGGYTLGAADLLRRAMGKKIKSEMDAQRDIFVKGALSNGIKESVASQIFDQMAKFAGYGFNKSHASPYALISYQTAYLKANYPTSFFAASLTYDMHNTDKIALYHHDMKAMGIRLLPPCINASKSEFSCEGHDVRYGLSAIKNVGIDGIQELQAKKPFKDLSDFARRFNRNKLNKRQMEHLILSGAFDIFEKNRKKLYDNIEVIYRYNETCEQNILSKQKTLFAKANDALVLADSPGWTHAEMLQKEYEALGFYLTSHPILEVIEKIDVKFTPSTIQEERELCTMIGLILSKKERLSKKSQKYAFVQLSDQNGLFEIAVFPKLYEKAHTLLMEGNMIVLHASIRFENDERRIVAQDILDPGTLIPKIICDEKQEEVFVVDDSLHIINETDFSCLDEMIHRIKELKKQRKRICMITQDNVSFFIG